MPRTLPASHAVAGVGVIPREVALQRYGPLGVGIVGLVLSVTGSWVPSFWRDETASAHMASLSPTDIVAVTDQVDAVFGLYYGFVHAWAAVVGVSEFGLRLPSAVAVGIGAAAVTLTSRRLAGPGFGVLAGLIFAALPRMTAMGIEARPYAMSAAAMAVLGLLALRVIERPGAGLVVAYALTGTVATYLHLYAVLAVAALLVSGWVLATNRPARVALSLGTAAVVAATAPLAFRAVGQAGSQISWIPVAGAGLVEQVAVEQYIPFRTAVRFLTPDQEAIRWVAVALAAVVWLLIAALLISGREFSGSVASGRVASGRDRRRAVLVFALPGVVVPTAAVVAYSVLVSPAYLPRYLVATAPAFAMLLAAAVHTMRPTPIRVGVVALIGALWLPVYVMQRQPFAKFLVDDYAFIAREVHARANPGDAILFDDRTTDPVESGRNALDGYPSSFDAVDDLASAPEQSRRTTSSSPQRPLTTILPEVTRHQRLWLVTFPETAGGDPAYRDALARLGYSVAAEVDGPTHRLQLWTRG